MGVALAVVRVVGPVVVSSIVHVESYGVTSMVGIAVNGVVVRLAVVVHSRSALLTLGWGCC